MKRFWTISTLAVLAAMIFGSLLHRRGQESATQISQLDADIREIRTPSFVAEMPMPVQESEMPFDYPLIPELLPEPKRALPEVKFASTPASREQSSFPKVEFSAEERDDVITSRKLVTTVSLAKVAVPTDTAAAEKAEVELPPVAPAVDDGRFFPIVLHIGFEDEKLVLQGSIPTRENTDAVIAAAVKLVGEDSVESHLKYSPETINADWVDDLPGYIEKFFGHSAGDQELIVVDGILKLRGDVSSANTRNGLLTLAESFKEGGLKIDHELEVKEALAGDIPELSGTYAALPEESTGLEESEPEEAIELAMLDSDAQLSIGDDAKSRSAAILADERELTTEAELNAVSEVKPGPVEKEEPVKKFLGPAESPEEWAAAIKKEREELAAVKAAKIAAEKAAAKEKAEREVAALAAAEKKKAEMEAAAKAEAEKKAADLAAAEKKKAEMEAAEAAAKEAKLAAMIEAGEEIPDDGKPLIFYFETGSSEIISSDREKIARAIQRAKIPRSIVYITAYADYRGGYESNRKLSLERAEKVRGLIFAGDIADEVTADIKAKGESNSSGNKSEEAMRRSRRVVVEVYHLKR